MIFLYWDIQNGDGIGRDFFVESSAGAGGRRAATNTVRVAQIR